MCFEKFCEVNEGREGKLALSVKGEPIPCSRYLGNGKMIVRCKDGGYELYSKSMMEPTNVIRLSMDAVDIIGNLDI